MSLELKKSIAVWLINNTPLTFEQISDFCEMTVMEIQAIADGYSCQNMQGIDPIIMCQLSKEDIEKCSENPELRLSKPKPIDPTARSKKHKTKYTPRAARSSRPEAIAWLLEHHPELSYVQIRRLISTTTNMIKNTQEKIANKTIIPRSPVSLGMCSQQELEYELLMSKKKRI